MPVNTPHPAYTAASPQWAKCRHAAAGEEAVKAAGEAYLPRLTEQTQKEYDAYKGRALFYNATGRTVDGMTGLVFRKPPQVEIPSALEYNTDSVDRAGTPLGTFCEKVLEELVTVGRVGILTDFPRVDPRSLTQAAEQAAGVRPYSVIYPAESIINWRTGEVGGRKMLTMLVLQEDVQEPKDEFASQAITQWRVLKLDNGGVYRVEIWRRPRENDEPVKVDEWTPLQAGQPMRSIPFGICGPRGIEPGVCKSPILDLVNVNISHYRSTADYEHGLHFTGLPTPIVIGHTFQDGEKIALGSATFQAFSTQGAQVQFLEFTGAGLSSLSKRLEEKESMMVSLGARMLAAEKRQVEAAETAAIHRAGESSVLASLANAASALITQALQWQAMFARAEGAQAKVTLNTDYLPSGMTAQELTALVQAWQGGAISRDTLLDNLQRGEILPTGRTIEEEKAAIEADGPALGVIGANGGNGQ